MSICTTIFWEKEKKMASKIDKQLANDDLHLFSSFDY